MDNISNTIIAGIVLASISGLGFLSYKHPVYTGKLLIRIQGLVLALTILVASHSFVKMNAYYDCFETTYFIKSKKDTIVDFYGLVTKMENKDSIKMLWSEFQRQGELLDKSEKSTEDFQNNYRNNIHKLIAKNQDNTREIFKYSISAAIIIVFFQILSFSFEKLHEKSSSTENKSKS